MRREAGYPQIDREIVGNAVAHLRAPPERAAVYGAGADGDDEARIRHRIVRRPQGRTHVGADGPGDHDAVSMTRGGDELHPEPGEVEDHVAQCHQLRLAAVAASGGYRAQPERPAEEAAAPLVQGPSQLHFAGPRAETLPGRAGHPELPREADRSVRTHR